MASKEADTAKRRLQFQKSYSQERGGSWRKRSLIEDAKFDRVTNAEFAKQEQERKGSIGNEEILPDDDVFTVANGDAHTTPETLTRKCSLLFSSKENSGLCLLFKSFEDSNVQIDHLESRPCRRKGGHLEVLVQCTGLREDTISLVKTLKQNPATYDVQLISDRKPTTENHWFPLHISELDCCNHLLTKFDPDLDQHHPGFTDKMYRDRRKQIGDIAFEYRHGQPIPRIEYRADEIKTWGTVFRMLKTLYSTHACKEHIEVFRVLEQECGYCDSSIPQLEDVSRFMKRKSGFQLRPVAGLLSARDFLASLAFRVFQCTQYLRHGSKPDHTVEPDCVHELLGHVPMLANRGFAQFSQEIGLASLGASDEDIEKFATLYWFTVEFGLCMQDGQVKAYGAGLLSAFGELKYALSDKPEKRPFDPPTTSVQAYDDQDYQKIYFVCESFEDMKEKVRQYAATIHRPYEVRYDPYTESLQILDNETVIQDITRVIGTELNCLENTLHRVKHLTVV